MSTSRRLREQIDRIVTSDEARRYIDAPITLEERDAVRALCDWFIRRYPTPLDRLAYVRRAYARWQTGGGKK